MSLAITTSRNAEILRAFHAVNAAEHEAAISKLKRIRAEGLLALSDARSVRYGSDEYRSMAAKLAPTGAQQ